MKSNPMTHKQRRKCMTGWLMSVTRWRAKANKAKRELGLENAADSHVTHWLLTNFYSPLAKFRRSGENDLSALSRYVDDLERQADAYIACIGEMTGFGYFDFNDWWQEVFRGAYHMKVAERQERRFHQSVYARKQIAATVTKQVLEGVKFSDFDDMKEVTNG
jgi:hypothetical protein